MENEIIWLCDVSGSMSTEGKIQGLDYSILNAAESLKTAGESLGEKSRKLQTRMIQFSDEASWAIKDRLDIDAFIRKWKSEDVLIPDSNVSQMELVFLIDTSLSMKNELETLKAECQNFINRLHRSGLLIKASIVGAGIGKGEKDTKPFNKKTLGGNVDNAYTLGATPLASVDAFYDNIEQLRIGMFGPRGCFFGQKNSVIVFKEIVDIFTNEENQKVLIVISDDVGDDGGRAQIINLLRTKHISCSVIGKKDRYNIHSAIATLTEGYFYDIEHNRSWDNGFSTTLANLSGQIAREKSNGSDMASAIDLLSLALKDHICGPNVQNHITAILVSDGKPSSDISQSLNKFREVSKNTSISQFAIGIGSDFDETVLLDFVEGDNNHVFSAKEPGQLSVAVTSVYENACLENDRDSIVEFTNEDIVW